MSIEADQVNKGKLSDDELKQVERIQKLLNTAANPGTPAEGEAALKLAQTLMTKYNLDQATVEGNSGGQGRRLQEEVVGGFLKVNRDLWNAVADLHFCVYWSQKFRTADKVRQTHRIAGEYVGMRMVHAMRRRHALVGRSVNVAMCKAMATYLEGAVERALREAIAGVNAEVAYAQNAKSEWAHSFRKGAIKGVIDKIEDRRYEELKKEQQAKRRAERSADGVSTSKALTIASYSQSEADANADFLHGEGWSAEMRQLRQERAEERRLEREAAVAWAKANPEEAAKLQEEDRKREERNAKRRVGRWSGGREERGDLGGYYAGKEASDKIGIDPQAEARGGTAGRLS